ncbi:MAG: hypothetical protein SLAVMIC_00273 [uncultured marine phage]|uniref:Uncharacterized protein n=1 Tax=uncultured marine phage TaxID=707152 RepID=A0A8D9C8M6_9VIRU|nr:MAG: hypothetical protein SLAVMIC_00273 [uncultured marine phage]
MRGSKINVWRVKNIVSTQVIELNNYDYVEGGTLFTSSDGFKIKSESVGYKYHGGISKNALWLPTSPDIRNYKVNSIIFFENDGGEDGAKKLLNRINKSLFEWKEVHFKLPGDRSLIDKIWIDHFEEKFPMSFREEFNYLMEDGENNFILDGGDVSNKYDYRQYMLGVASDIVSDMDLEYGEWGY